MSEPAGVPETAPAEAIEREEHEPMPTAVNGPHEVPPRGPVTAKAGVGVTTPPLLDPAVARRKFEREVANYRAQEAEYLKRGWILLRAEYPTVTVLLAAAHMVPSPVLLGVTVDFANYDFWAPSVRFVHPFTLRPLSAPEVLPIMRKLVAPDGQFVPQSLVQHQADLVPFLCVQGVREYHAHPFHTNDPWLASRSSGVGTLNHILDVIYRHGILPLQFSIQVNAAQVGLTVDPARLPE